MSIRQTPHLWIPKAKILEPRDPLTMKVGLAAEFRLRAIRPNGQCRVDTGFFHNLITNVGLNDAHSGTATFNAISVGTGNTPPAYTDTTLAARVATTTTVQSSQEGQSGSPGDPDFYRWVEKTLRFAQGVAQGNLTEVGATRSSSPYTTYSRALILDGSGNPTTLTVLADEFLDVTYRVRFYPGDTSDVNTSILISGQSHDIVLRPAEMDGTSNLWRPGSGSIDWNVRMGHPGTFGFANSGHHQVYPSTSVLGPITGSPSGTGLSSGTSSGNAAYINGTFFQDFFGVWGLNEGNAAGGIAAVRVAAGYGRTLPGSGGSACAAYQFSLNPVIAKTNSHILTLNFRQSWARRAI